MHRFFVQSTSRPGSHVDLSGPTAHQIARVLRLRPNEEIVVIPTGGEDAVEWRVRLETVEARLVTGAVVAVRPGLPEPTCAVTLCAAILKGERFDWLVQKATELGVAAIQPVLTANTIRRIGPDDRNALERWQRIATEAAEQSGRNRAPTIGPPIALERLGGAVPSPVFVAHEATTAETLGKAIPENAGALSVMIGPEGGLMEMEVANLVTRCGALPVSLGPRILRAETAAITAVTLVLSATKNLEPPRERPWQELRETEEQHDRPRTGPLEN